MFLNTFQNTDLYDCTYVYTYLNIYTFQKNHLKNCLPSPPNEEMRNAFVPICLKLRNFGMVIFFLENLNEIIFSHFLKSYTKIGTACVTLCRYSNDVIVIIILNKYLNFVELSTDYDNAILIT